MSPNKALDNAEMLQGTMDMLILRTLVMGSAHGHTIARIIEHTSEDVLQVEEGSLYPALQRLLKAKLVRAEWTISPSTNRRVRVYEITRSGLRRLEREISSFDRMLEGRLVSDEQLDAAPTHR